MLDVAETVTDVFATVRELAFEAAISLYGASAQIDEAEFVAELSLVEWLAEVQEAD